MSQNPVQIPTGSALPGLNLVNDLNSAFASVMTLFSGSSAPTTGTTGLSGTAGIPWHDTGTNTLWIRNQADSAWIPITTIDETDGSVGLVKAVKVQSFASSATYTPSAGMLYCIVEVLGGGAGGGATVAGSSGQAAAGGGGSSGAYGKGVFTASAVGTSQTITIGAGGLGGASGANNGSNGGQTNFGSLIYAEGGEGGQYGSPSSGPAFGSPGFGNSVAAAGGFINVPGFSGEFGIGYAPTFGLGGQGGSCIYGSGGVGGLNNQGSVGTGYGSGGAGAGGTTTANSGNTGASGLCIVTEFCNQ